MALTYRNDKDLRFLQECSSDDLSVLVSILTKTKDGSPRVTQELTEEAHYKQYYPDHAKYWYLIAAELQTFGGNTFMNTARGHGVLYRELLMNACKKMKVNYNSSASVEVIEMNLLMKILTDSLEKMNTEELRTIAEDLNLKPTELSKQAVIAALQAGVRFSGFAAYQVAMIVANQVAKILIGRGLSVAANAGLNRAIAVFTGPIGWVLMGLWTLVDIAGPAYRVTIPCVIQIAFLRAKMKYGE